MVGQLAVAGLRERRLQRRRVAALHRRQRGRQPQGGLQLLLPPRLAPLPLLAILLLPAQQVRLLLLLPALLLFRERPLRLRLLLLAAAHGAAAEHGANLGRAYEASAAGWGFMKAAAERARCAAPRLMPPHPMKRTSGHGMWGHQLMSVPS